MKKRKAPEILETTLRDGSYVINFQFTASDTEVIASVLQEAGFEWIEIGHGVGLNASKMGLGQAAETDEGYLKAAAKVLNKAKFGMFCIPGIARLEDIDMCAQHGMKFIRIGTEISRMEESRTFIERAKKHGLFVAANFMKSYTMEPKRFAEKALLSKKYGADVLYVVDSAGGMFPQDVHRYIQAVRDVCEIDIGFHGHNNLDLAVANSIQAVDDQARFIDTSLQGMGRSAGNTPTEIFLLVMERRGIEMEINPLQVIDIGEKYIKPITLGPRYDALDMICGYAEFHSSYMGVIREFSTRYQVDPRRLIIELTRRDKINAPRALVEKIATELSREKIEVYSARFDMKRYYGAEQSLDDE